jgi:hypothetical protein
MTRVMPWRSGSGDGLLGARQLPEMIPTATRALALGSFAQRIVMSPAERRAQLQAAVSKARGSAPLLLNLKEVNCDGYPNTRA